MECSIKSSKADLLAFLRAQGLADSILKDCKSLEDVTQMSLPASLCLSQKIPADIAQRAAKWLKSERVENSSSKMSELLELNEKQKLLLCCALACCEAACSVDDPCVALKKTTLPHSLCAAVRSTTLKNAHSILVAETQDKRQIFVCFYAKVKEALEGSINQTYNRVVLDVVDSLQSNQEVILCGHGYGGMESEKLYLYLKRNLNLENVRCCTFGQKFMTESCETFEDSFNVITSEDSFPRLMQSLAAMKFCGHYNENTLRELDTAIGMFELGTIDHQTIQEKIAETAAMLREAIKSNSYNLVPKSACKSILIHGSDAILCNNDYFELQKIQWENIDLSQRGVSSYVKALSFYCACLPKQERLIERFQFFDFEEKIDVEACQDNSQAVVTLFDCKRTWTLMEVHVEGCENNGNLQVLEQARLCRQDFTYPKGLDVVGKKVHVLKLFSDVRVLCIESVRTVQSEKSDGKTTSNISVVQILQKARDLWLACECTKINGELPDMLLNSLRSIASGTTVDPAIGLGSTAVKLMRSKDLQEYHKALKEVEERRRLEFVMRDEILWETFTNELEFHFRGYFRSAIKVVGAACFWAISLIPVSCFDFFSLFWKPASVVSEWVSESIFGFANSYLEGLQKNVAFMGLVIPPKIGENSRIRYCEQLIAENLERYPYKKFPTLHAIAQVYILRVLLESVTTLCVCGTKKKGKSTLLNKMYDVPTNPSDDVATLSIAAYQVRAFKSYFVIDYPGITENLADLEAQVRQRMRSLTTVFVLVCDGDNMDIGMHDGSALRLMIDTKVPILVCLNRADKRLQSDKKKNNHEQFIVENMTKWLSAHYQSAWRSLFGLHETKPSVLEKNKDYEKKFKSMQQAGRADVWWTSFDPSFMDYSAMRPCGVKSVEDVRMWVEEAACVKPIYQLPVRQVVEKAGIELIELMWYDGVLSSPILHPRILCLDGGGIKGLIHIEFLITLEERTNRKVHELFDLIVGTSTGAILAMAAGILRLPLKECRDLYLELGPILFGRGKPKNLMKRAVSARLDPKHLEAALKMRVGASTKMSELKDVHPKVAFIATNLKKKMYQAFVNDSECKCEVWKAVMASAAAPTYFDPVIVDGESFVDGGVGYNNPTGVAFEISKKLFGAPPSIVVSSGCGEKVEEQIRESFLSLGQTAVELKQMISHLTSTNGVHEWAKSNCSDYFRFNPTAEFGNLGRISLDDARVESTGALQDGAKRFYEDPKTAEMVDKCASKLLENEFLLLEVKPSLECFAAVCVRRCKRELCWPQLQLVQDWGCENLHNYCRLFFSNTPQRNSVLTLLCKTKEHSEAGCVAGSPLKFLATLSYKVIVRETHCDMDSFQVKLEKIDQFGGFGKFSDGDVDVEVKSIDQPEEPTFSTNLNGNTNTLNIEVRRRPVGRYSVTVCGTVTEIVLSDARNYK